MVFPELLSWWGETVSVHLLKCIPAHSLTYTIVSFFCLTYSQCLSQEGSGRLFFFLSFTFWSVPQARGGRKLLYEHLWPCTHWKVLSRHCGSAQLQEFALPEWELLSSHLIKRNKGDEVSRDDTHNTFSSNFWMLPVGPTEDRKQNLRSTRRHFTNTALWKWSPRKDSFEI